MSSPGPSVTEPTDQQHALIREVHEKVLELSNWLVGRLERGPEVDAALVKLSEVRSVLHATVLNAQPVTMPTNHHLLITANPNYPKVDNSRPDGDQAAADQATSPNPAVATVPNSPVADPASAVNEANDGTGSPEGAGESVAPVAVQTGASPLGPDGEPLDTPTPA